MATFLDILEAMRREQDEGGPLLDSGEETKAMEAIRNGMNIRKPECGDFWEDFISVSGNADAMADLLEVPKEKITSWGSKIRDLLEKVKQADGEESDSENSRSEMVPTGNQGMIGDQQDTSTTNRRPDPS
ncbi:MAG: hypothetical protein ACW99G_06965 [Candidatus Thorarchaeota archaeon]|jgi:hypothetical protein